MRIRKVTGATGLTYRVYRHERERGDVFHEVTMQRPDPEYGLVYHTLSSIQDVDAFLDFELSKEEKIAGQKSEIDNKRSYPWVMTEDKGQGHCIFFLEQILEIRPTALGINVYQAGMPKGGELVAPDKLFDYINRWSVAVHKDTMMEQEGKKVLNDLYNKYH